MKVTMFSGAECPRCEVLENKLKEAGIEFGKNTDIDKIRAMGFLSAPVLQVTMTYAEAFKWVMNQKENE